MKALKGGWKSLYIITSKTTKDDLYVFDKITTEDKLVAYNDSDGFVEFTPSSVDVSDFLNTLDIFGDGSCIACYPFNGNANDLGGNYNGTWSGTEQYDIGKFGQCAKFDGNSYVDLGNILNDVFASNNFTVSVWWNFSQLTDDYGYSSMLIDKWHSSGYSDNAFVLYPHRFQAGNNVYAETDKNQLSLNTWHLTVGVMKPDGTIELYIDGKKVAENTGAECYTTDYHLVIGGFTTNNYYYVKNGLIDQVRIFNRDLTQEEVRILYNGEKYYHCQLPSSLNKTPTKVFKKESPSIWVSIPFEQETDENDWYQYQAEVKEKPEEVKIISATKDEIRIPEIIIKGEKLLLYSNEEIVEKNVDNYPETINTVNVLDIFGDASCIATYTFDGNANDLGGNYNGNWNGNEQYDTGKFEQCAKFDGNSYIVVSPPPIVNLKSNFSISLWFKAEDISSETHHKIFTCLNKTSYDDECSYTVGLFGNQLKYYFEGDDDSDYQSVILEDTKPNKWYFMILSMQNNIAYIKVYDTNGLLNSISVDSKQVYTKNVDELIFAADYEASTKKYADFFVGLIDQVRIFNKLLSEDEIKVLYNEKLYKLNISSLNITNPPEKAWKEPTKVYVVMETTPDRCLWEDEDLSDQIVNSTTDSIEVVDSRKNIILPKDIIIIDSNKEVEVENVTSSDSTQVLDIFGDGSCIATYTFDGSANDLSGNYNGSWSGTEQYDTGKFGQAAKFDGSGYVEINSLNNPFKNDFTVAFWFKALERVDEINGRSDCVFAGNTDYRFGLALREYYSASGNLEMRWSIGDGNSWVEYFGPKKDGSLNDTTKWYFLVLTKSGHLYKFYRNGVLWYQYEASHSDYSGDAFVRMGIWGNNEYYDTKCLIDQVRIFNRSLTEKEIKILYNEGYKHLINIPTQSSAPTKLIVPDRTIEQTLLTREYDETNNIIKSTYKTVRKNGRAIRVKLEGNKGILVNNLKVNLWTGE